MLRNTSNICKGIVWACLTFCIVGALAQSGERSFEENKVSTLPSDIAKKLRDRNTPGERYSCNESNIFVHGFEYLDLSLHRLIWFLGAPDYLCETNSFIPVILDGNGTWTAGQNSEEDWRGLKMLAGVPVLFQHVDDLGFFLTSEWQVEGPRNLMYYSADGVIWTSLDLPAPTDKRTDYGCCNAASIRNLCIADSGIAYISYEEDSEFHASIWGAPIDGAFPRNINWSRVPKMPDDAHCDGLWPHDFIPHSLRAKTKAGSLFDVAYDRKILIPGPTK